MADDPEEVDISRDNSFAATPTTGRPPNPQENPLAAAMLQMEQERQAQGGGANDDPLMKMMQQMMGGMGGDPNDPQDLPPMLKAMMGAAGAGAKQEPTEPATSSAYIWRIVHAIFAFGLAIYICLSSTFNGTKLARSQNVYTEETGYGLGPRLFIIFTSAELVLQSTRYFVEKGQLQGGGMLATVANSGFIPEPYANYIRVLGRYLTIARTIFVDVMVIVFVLGCMAWWQGMAIEA
ncbi:uncharacterized protein MYCFIDRAFT_181585 [Pseudocercospora fijiensis CIRAD86]|uniref:GET complex, subunit GET2 n=1 Tax=Pseudocercospora fijiensis (strain CIRAD86) TaxID=383855 RepID=N1Q9L4_PSEFD|nr:uncharacterized protein MYCFIDRAFT_181585 [Pseudocercospora fijiensis CIRAD86]EME89564.1 hypothetical protein MYCFIDRAFT_181585 [Pseudocercospora fijiensis CIRAD86]